jgi:hypothetical protein
MAAASPAQTRPRREREEELLVWPDLVFVEFIAATLFTITFTIVAAMVRAPLINRANPDVTPNPSKAPWYFLNLQELLLHMHPALAGVIVPTIALLLLAAIPYLDRSREGQGVWFGTPNAVKISAWSGIFAAVVTPILIVWDQGRFALWWTQVTGVKWMSDWDMPDWVPGIGVALWDLVFIRQTRSIQTEWQWSINVEGLQLGGGDGTLDWPQDFTHIPMPFNGTSWPKWGGESGEPPPDWYQDLPGWLTGNFWYDLNLNLPAFVVEIFIPTFLMVALPIFLVYLLWRVGWIQTRRDVMLSIFTGFIVLYWVMTIIGAGFRGAGQDLVLPWDVPLIDG